MGNYNLIGIDLDGTLLGSDNMIPDLNRRALEKADEKGKEVVIVTGRLLESGLKISDKLGVGRYVIACNGAVTYDKKTKKIINKSIIDSDMVKKVISLAKKRDMFYQIYNEHNYIQGKKELENLTERQKDMMDKFYRADGIKILRYEDILNEFDFDGENIYKFIFMDNDEGKLSSFRKELEKIEGLSVSSSHKGNVELMNEGVNKGWALKNLCKELGIALEETIGIGDNENDLEMIKTVGLGVAMANARDLLKEHSDLVTDTNDNCGLAKLVEKYML